MRTKRILAGALMALAVSATTVAVAGQPAQAYARLNGKVVNLHPGSNGTLYLDGEGAATPDGPEVVQWTWLSNRDYQQWVFVELTRIDRYNIVNRGTHMCLTSDGVPGHAVTQQPCDDTFAQMWDTDLVPDNLHYYSIRNARSGLYLDVTGNAFGRGAKLCTWYYNGNRNQYFRAGLA